MSLQTCVIMYTCLGVKREYEKGVLMSERSLSVSPAIEPIAGGVIGLGIGYSLAPKKYSLRQLLSMPEDKFEKVYYKNLVENMPDKSKQALSEIKMARIQYTQSKNSVAEHVSGAAKEWRDKFERVEVADKFIHNRDEAKANLQKAIKETDYIELNQKYRAAKAALKNDPDNVALKQALLEANTNLATVKARLAAKMDIYRSSVRNLEAERLIQVKNNPAKNADVRNAYKEFLGALAQRRTICANKLFELTNNNNLKKCYESVKDYLPKARTKAAVTGAVILGSMTAAMTFFINSATKKVA